MHNVSATAPITCRPLQARSVFGVSRDTIYRWAKQGHVRLYQRGGMTFLRVDEVRDFITGTEGAG